MQTPTPNTDTKHKYKYKCKSGHQEVLHPNQLKPSAALAAVRWLAFYTVSAVSHLTIS